ncbi:hypothetical protein C7414_10183 [Cupriavidus alkaliphilus]|uniref:extracellular catalytic domain type 2 short-chain-length polyhydroxyalkanoate depolymerase n=1 Tax=Cupriavidus alkaliphilus TaxID=942866 RepID=UPI000DE730F7|nr:poly(3-hydroxybutyrate) depolymerase [Cupriavidus alkaliphilus]PVY81347.1 hypothetical protein C7414_10183 [Cupriavidus alkaliphilus]
MIRCKSTARYRALGAACALGVSGGAAAQALPALGADLAQTSVSGLSSGAFMATQFHVAYSGTMVGAGVVAGGPFYCAGLFAPTPPATAAATQCMQPVGDTGPDAQAALDAARTFARDGRIDPVQNLARQRVYVFSGTRDQTVLPRVAAQVGRFYTLGGVPASQLQYVADVAAGHAFITSQAGDAACAASASPYINNCGLEQARQILQWIYGALKPAARPSGELLRFDQRAFDPGGKALLADSGYVYVPRECGAGGADGGADGGAAACRVHVAFHGCLQGAGAVGERFVRGAGYLESAEANRIVVLFPQVVVSRHNPLGCWDFWGYTSDDPAQPDFFSREAPQMAAVMRMVRRLGAAPQ